MKIIINTVYKSLLILFMTLTIYSEKKIKCSKCGFENSANDRYCLECVNELKQPSKTNNQTKKNFKKEKVLRQYNQAISYFQKAKIQSDKKLAKLNSEAALRNATNALSFGTNFLSKKEKNILANMINQLEVRLQNLRKSLNKVTMKGEKRIPLIKKRNAYYVKVLLNNRVKATLHLDTGCSGVFISKNLASKLNIGKRQKGRSIVADGRTVPTTYFYLKSIDLNGNIVNRVEASYGQTNGDGLLGMSYLKYFQFRIDTETHELILSKKD